MDINEHVAALRRDLGATARAMGPEIEEAAERLTLAVDSATRLALLHALSDAAAEITARLDGTSVEVRLQGRDPEFVVTGAGAPDTSRRDTTVMSTSGDTRELPVDEEGAETARITLRLPDALKARAEELAFSRGQSLNTFLVNAVRSGVTGDDRGDRRGPGAPGRNRRSNKRVQGWVR